MHRQGLGIRTGHKIEQSSDDHHRAESAHPRPRLPPGPGRGGAPKADKDGTGIGDPSRPTRGPAAVAELLKDSLSLGGPGPGNLNLIGRRNSICHGSLNSLGLQPGSGRRPLWKLSSRRMSCDSFCEAAEDSRCNGCSI